MALSGKKVEKKKISTQMFMGLADVKPVKGGVNPSKAQLKAMNKGGNREPVYLDTSKDEVVHRVRIYHTWEFGGVTFTEPIIFRLMDKLVTSTNSGKSLYINNKNQYKWAMSLEDIAEDNAAAGPDEPYKLFNVENEYRPRVARKGEAGLMQYLTALSGFSTNDPTFNLDVAEYWDEGIMDGNVDALIRDIEQFDSLRVLVMIDEARQAMEIFSDESVVGQSAFLQSGAIPYKASPFMKNLFNLQKDHNGEWVPGEYSKANKYKIGFEPQLVERSMPDISNFLQSPAEMEDTTYHAASNDAGSNVQEELPF